MAELHPNVLLAPAAVDLSAFSSGPARRREANVRRAVYAGSVDFRFDAELLAAAAGRLPDWQFVLAGPVDRGPHRILAHIPNVELMGQIEPGSVPPLLASASACLMPYRRDRFNETLFPIKLIEYLAAGRPVIATPIRAAREFSDVVHVAEGSDEFARALQSAVDADSAEAQQRRVDRAQPYSWERRIDQMEAAMLEALASGR